MDNLPHHVIRPEPHVFDDYVDEKFETTVQVNPNESVSLKKAFAAHGARVYITERVDYPEYGIMMKYQGVPYVRQGFIFPEALDNVNHLKRLSVLFLAIIKGNGYGFIKGRIGAFLAHYVRIADWMFQFYDPNSGKIRRIYLKPHRYRQSVRELIKLINNFLSNLGIKVIEFKGASENDFGRVVGTMIEYDNAYHWRMEDVFSETIRERLLANPRKELKRLLQIYSQREKATAEFKAQALEKALVIFYLPNVKKAFRKAIESIDVEKLKMTKDDRYYTMNYEGYEFEGRTIEDRNQEWVNMTGGTPPPRVLIPQQN